MTTLSFKDYMLASDSPENRQYIGCSAVRRTEDWWRLYEVANEMVEKYGLDGSGIPLGATIVSAEHAEVCENLSRGYKGIRGSRIGTFNGPVDDSKWKDHYFAVIGRDCPKWFYRPCWWRFLIVMP